MEELLYLLAGLSIFLALGGLYGYSETKHPGLLLSSFISIGAAFLAIDLVAWWPLILSFAANWVLRLLGLDPGTDGNGSREITGEIPKITQGSLTEEGVLAKTINANINGTNGLRHEKWTVGIDIQQADIEMFADKRTGQVYVAEIYEQGRLVQYLMPKNKWEDFQYSMQKNLALIRKTFSEEVKPPIASQAGASTSDIDLPQHLPSASSLSSENPGIYPSAENIERKLAAYKARRQEKEIAEKARREEIAEKARRLEKEVRCPCCYKQFDPYPGELYCICPQCKKIFTNSKAQKTSTSVQGVRCPCCDKQLDAKPDQMEFYCTRCETSFTRKV
jgi:hypothetical protein